MRFALNTGFLTGPRGFPFCAGWTLTAQGGRKDGIKQMRRGLAVYSATGAEIGRPLFLALLADAYREGGQARSGLAVAADALRAVRRTGDRFGEPELHRIKGELLWATSYNSFMLRRKPASAKRLDVSRRQNAKSFELRAAMSLSRLWQKHGKRAEARKMLAEVYGRFTEGFDSPDQEEARLMLD